MRRSVLHAPAPTRSQFAFRHIGFVIRLAILAMILFCVRSRSFLYDRSQRGTPTRDGSHRPNPLLAMPRFRSAFSSLSCLFLPRRLPENCIPYSRVLEGQHLSVHPFPEPVLARISPGNHLL